MHYSDKEQVWKCCDAGPIVYDVYTDGYYCSICKTWYSHNEGKEEPTEVGNGASTAYKKPVDHSRPVPLTADEAPMANDTPYPKSAPRRGRPPKTV